jgi:hypothetical protein
MSACGKNGARATLVIAAAATLAGCVVAPPPPPPAPAAQARHPAYLHALSDLRAARWLIQHRPGDWVQNGDEMEAVRPG